MRRRPDSRCRVRAPRSQQRACSTTEWAGRRLAQPRRRRIRDGSKARRRTLEDFTPNHPKVEKMKITQRMAARFGMLMLAIAVAAPAAIAQQGDEAAIRLL